MCRRLVAVAVPVAMAATTVVIVAAGGGTRAGPGLAKQWRGLSGKPVLRWSVAALLAAGARDIVVVVSEDGETLAAEALAGLTGWRTARGAATRAGSRAT